jgi:hypothetical protein
MKTITFLLLLISTTIFAQKMVQYDTLESGSSDSLITFYYDTPEAVKSVSYGMQQLDTNATNPDSALAYKRFSNASAISPYFPIDFNESTDSLFRALSFTYANGAGKLRGGWLWKPGTDNISFRMSNAVYLTNRRIVIWVKFNTQ